MKKMVVWVLISLVVLMLFPQEGNASAVQTKIILDGKTLKLPANAKVTQINDSVMIPIRVVAESLKFKVDWNPKTQGVSIQQGNQTIALTIGKKKATASDTQVSLNVPPKILNNIVVVPLRFVSEQMGLAVYWSDNTVYLTSPKSPTSSGGTTLEHEGGEVKEPVKHVKGLTLVNNQLTVSLDGDVTPAVTTLQNPDRIVIDLPNTNFDPAADTSLPLDAQGKGKMDVRAYPNLTEVRYSLFHRDPDLVRVVVQLPTASGFEVKRDPLANTLTIDLNGNESSTNPTSSLNKKIVVIDPGHGGSDPGATSVASREEKNFTLALSLKVQQILLQEPNIEVVMTRDQDIYPTRTERVILAKQLQADLYVSIHGNNSATSPTASGTETYYYQRNSSNILASIIHKHLVQALGFKDRGVKSGNFQVIRETTMPAVLLEIGFLSNSTEEAAMHSEEIQYKAAQAIVDGIKEYLNLYT